MYEIKSDGTLYAIYESDQPTKNKTNWYGDDKQFLQVARFCYDKDKNFKCHKHKTRQRISDLTQEAMMVISGQLEASIYDNNKNLLDTVILKAGNFIIVYAGCHAYKVLSDDTVFLEFKNGPFTTVEEDKDFV